MKMLSASSRFAGIPQSRGKGHRRSCLIAALVARTSERLRVVTYDEGDDLKYEVVWSANEDTTGVHEVLWSANGWWPEKPASERLRMAEEAVRWALDRRLTTCSTTTATKRGRSRHMSGTSR